MARGSLLAWTERLDRHPAAVQAAVWTGVAAVALVDQRSGPELSMAFPYTLCVIVAAWFLSTQIALGVAGVATVSAFAIRVSAGDVRWMVLLANTALLALSFVVFARLAAAARRSVGDLLDRARLDELTGVLSRRGFLDALTAARRRAIERGAPLGIVYLDLDGLKRVNDLEGHAAGDALIARFVDNVGGHLRGSDLFGRLGGDEFAIVLERVDALVIEGVVSRILSDPEVPEASCGVRVYDGEYPSAKEMLAGADRRMYADKRRRKGDRGEWRSELSLR